MKKLIASILTVLTIGASAQLTYVTTIDDYVETSMVHDDEGRNFIDNDKYIITPFGGHYVEELNMSEYFDILNSDFSLHKRIKIDTTGWFDLGYLLDGIFFSDHLYNSDDKIEIIYSLSKKEYYTDEYGTEYIRHVNAKTVIIDEDGVVLQTIDNVRFDIRDLFQLDGKTYLQIYDGDGKMDIYEAAGTLPCKTCSSTEATSNKKAPEKAYDINVFPNPTTNQITLAINTDKTGMKVHIYSTDGKLVKSANVVNGDNLIDAADLVAGTYIYNVQTDTEVIHASQFVKK